MTRTVPRILSETLAYRLCYHELVSEVAKAITLLYFISLSQ